MATVSLDTSAAPLDARAVDPSWRDPRELVAAAVGVVLAVWTYIYYAEVILRRWNVGAFLLDFGWQNDAVSGRSLALAAPTGIGDYPYYAVHVSPILVPFALVSRLFHLSGAQPFALLSGLGFAGGTVMAFVILRRFLGREAGWAGLAAAAAGAALFTVSGLPRSIADYPHFEILYVTFGLAALHLIFQRRFVLAWIAFAACLSVKEDSGLQLATVMGAYLVLAAVEERALPARLRELAPFLGVGLAYPVLAILWQHTAWPGMSAFRGTYAGVPAFHHLTPQLYESRLADILRSHSWLLFTVASTLSVWAFRRRWTMLTGLVSLGPWLILNLSAATPAAGELLLYYAYPFMVAAMAPFIIAAAELPPVREESVLDVIVG